MNGEKKARLFALFAVLLLGAAGAWLFTAASRGEDTSESDAVEVADAAVVTSAIDQRFFTDEAGNRYWHILDPATGAPAASGLASATVVASSGGRADALSTALFVMGADRAAAFWRERQDFEMVLVGMDGHVWITEGLLDRFSAGEGLTGEAEVIR